MADDLASQLAAAIVTAAVRAAGNESDWPVHAARTELARDLDLILSVHLPQLSDDHTEHVHVVPDEWKRAAKAWGDHIREQAESAPRFGPERCENCGLYPDRLSPAADGYACPDYTPDERHRHTIGGQTWEHAHEGGHEAHSAVTHDLSTAQRIGPAYECPHGDPLCPCLGIDHQREAEDARAHARADADALDRIAEMLRNGCDLDGSDASDSVAEIVASTGRDVVPADEAEPYACWFCGNQIALRDDPSGQRGEEWGELAAWDDDRDFQCGVNPAGVHTPTADGGAR